MRYVFAILGLLQWIKRKSLFKVDHDILALGCCYILVFTTYLGFEIFYSLIIVQFLLHGSLEASFPSSHTMIVLSILGTAVIQFRKRIWNDFFKSNARIVCS